MGRKLGWMLMCSALVLPALANASPGTIAGFVRNSAGTPQMGAVVEIFSAARTPLTLVTDGSGYYKSGQLPTGSYQVKVSAPSYLPTLRENLILASGASLVVNVTLNTLFEALDMLPPLRVSSDHDDWNWTLRSAANRPVFRILNAPPILVESASDNGPPQHDQQETRALKARVAFVAGSEANGFGSVGEMATRFTLERSVFSNGTLSLGGNLGSNAGMQGVLRAAYSQQMSDGSKPQVALTLRRFGSPAASLPSSALEAMQLNFADTFQLGDFISLKVGSELQSVQFTRRVSAWRPFGSVDVFLTPNTVVEYQYATSAPTTRDMKGYDSAPLDLSESEPKISLRGTKVALQRARHQEVSVSRRWGANRFQVAAYRDQTRDVTLTGASYQFADFPGILADVYSGTFNYNAGNLTTDGLRVVAERKLTGALTANVTYSYGGVMELKSADRDWNALAFETSKRHSVSGSVRGETPGTGTRWIASYRWTSGQPLGLVDLFNSSPGRSDPYLNLFIRQPLPDIGSLPGHLEALVDLRNLLAQGYVPVVGPDGRTVYLVQSARSVRGGLAFVF